MTEATRKVLEMKPRTYTAKLFEVAVGNYVFQFAGTLDGFIDFAIPQSGTYPLSMAEAKEMVSALSHSIDDVEANCLHEKDVLLEE